MAGKFAARELSVCALFGALIFALAYVLGVGIISLTGIPSSGGVLNMLVTMLVLTVGVKTMDGRFGTASIILLVAATLAVPTVTFGAPGIHKIPQQMIIGLVYDLIVYVFKNKNSGYLVAGASCGALAFPVIFAFMAALNLPGVDKMAPLIALFSVLYAILGLLGAGIGIWVFNNKLSRKAILRQIKS